MKEIIVRSWWVWLFALICYAVFDYASARQDCQHERMEADLKAQEGRLARLEEEHQELLCKLQSQSDPAYMELVLMQNLGVVPEGQTKVYFSQ